MCYNLHLEIGSRTHSIRDFAIGYWKEMAELDWKDCSLGHC